MKPHHGDPDQALDWLQRKCLDPIKRSIASRSVRSLKQALDRPSFTEIEFITT